MVQVDPIKPKLKLPGTKHLKLKCDEPLSNFAFKFNLRRYDMTRSDRITKLKKNGNNWAGWACQTSLATS
jgi:hypothetical protein